MGVFATRATHRPNGLGLSVVKLEHIEIDNQNVVLHVSGLDLIDGTPIVDIKPYIPYSDSLPQAHYGFAQTAPITLPVQFSEALLTQFDHQSLPQSLAELITQVLAQDPRPAFHQVDETRIYGANLDNFNVNWRYKNLNGQTCIEVTEIIPL